ncbi:hypothetical protein J5X86_49170 [Streptomyces sp. NEAU-YJ-81]|nr:hypothetical protein [Streptomyces sp. NEAU-YJ-81]
MADVVDHPSATRKSASLVRLQMENGRSCSGGSDFAIFLISRRSGSVNVLGWPPLYFGWSESQPSAFSSIPMPVGRGLQQPVQLVPGFVVSGVGDPLQFAQVAGRGRASGEQEPGVHGPLVQQLAQLAEVAGCLGEVGQPVQSGLVALIGQLAQALPIDIQCLFLNPVSAGQKAERWRQGGIVNGFGARGRSILVQRGK